jgi:hypothetical protein
LSLYAHGNARFRLPTPGHRPGGPKAISYQSNIPSGDNLNKSSAAVQTTHVALQNAQINLSPLQKLYNELQVESHNTHMRAAAGERALRSPSAFVKYQLKRLHLSILNRLDHKVVAVDKATWRQGLREAREKAKLDPSKPSLKAVQQIANIETDRMEKAFHDRFHRPLGLRIYLYFVNSLKRLRM